MNVLIESPSTAQTVSGVTQELEVPVQDNPITLSPGLESRIDKDGPLPTNRSDLGPCWIYTGRLNNVGYGPHVKVYEKYVGPIPAGHDLDHLCRVRHCVNPVHLQPIPHIENVRRGLRGRLITHCPKGHPYDEQNTHMRRGRRYCRACEREYDRIRHDAAYWRAYRDRRAAKG